MNQANVHFSKVIILTTLVFSAIVILYTNFYSHTLSHIISFCQETASSLRAYLHIDESSLAYLVFIGLLLPGILLALITITRIIVSTIKLFLIKRDKAVVLDQKVIEVIAETTLDFNTIVLLKDDHPLAFTAGFFRPKIYLSTQLVSTLSIAEVEAVILHEYCHLSHKHVWLKASANIIKSLFYFLPIITSMANHLEYQIELMADEFVILKQGSSRNLRLVLAYTLKHAYKSEFVQFNGNVLEQRVHNLVGEKIELTYGGNKFVSSMIISLVILSVLIVLPQKLHAESWEQEPNIVTCETDFQQTHDASVSLMSIPASLGPFSHK